LFLVPKEVVEHTAGFSQPCLRHGTVQAGGLGRRQAMVLAKNAAYFEKDSAGGRLPCWMASRFRF